MSVLKCYNRKCPDYNRDKPDNCGHAFKKIRECDEAITKNPYKPKEKPRSEYHKMLMSDECYCGRSKKRSYSFCFNCYQSLPNNMQKDLYQRMGDGYEEAYEAAVEYLEREVL